MLWPGGPEESGCVCVLVSMPEWCWINSRLSVCTRLRPQFDCLKSLSRPGEAQKWCRRKSSGVKPVDHRCYMQGRCEGQEQMTLRKHSPQRVSKGEAARIVKGRARIESYCVRRALSRTAMRNYSHQVVIKEARAR